MFLFDLSLFCSDLFNKTQNKNISFYLFFFFVPLRINIVFVLTGLYNYLSGIFICQVSPLGQFLSSWLIYSNMPFFIRTASGKALISFLFAEFMEDYCNCIDLGTIAHTQTQKAGVRKTCIKSCYCSQVPEPCFYWLEP